MNPALPATTDAVVVGAGIVGACCADTLTAAGFRVTVVDRRTLAGGTTAAGEGNLLVSDKLGAELALALDSLQRWEVLADELEDDFELERKGGLVVAATEAEYTALRAQAARQREEGVVAAELGPGEARELEPHLSRTIAGAVAYPQDMQVQPVKATAAILRRARDRGATLHHRTEVSGIELRGARVTAVRTNRGTISTPLVIDAAGVGSRGLGMLAGVDIPVVPRRGHILVTEPVAPLIRHKVYDAEYVATVEGDPTRAGVSSVIEGTPAGTILIGSSRELVGFDRRPNLDVLAAMAARAVALFPVLAGVQVVRSYLGFRPYPPDQLPIIGPNPIVQGLVHATGHEGAGIGLAPGTADLVASIVTGVDPAVAPSPFGPDRPSHARAATALRAREATHA